MELLLAIGLLLLAVEKCSIYFILLKEHIL
jgi:hypothetical protein